LAGSNDEDNLSDSRSISSNPFSIAASSAASSAVPFQRTRNFLTKKPIIPKAPPRQKRKPATSQTTQAVTQDAQIQEGDGLERTQTAATLAEIPTQHERGNREEHLPNGGDLMEVDDVALEESIKNTLHSPAPESQCIAII